MPYCNYCGAQLEENEACDCEQAVLSSETGTVETTKKKGAFKLLFEAIAKPKTGTVEYVESGKAFSAIVLLLVYAALCGGMAWLLTQKLAERINSFVNLVDISGEKWFGIVFLLAGFSIFAHACLLILFYKMFKGPGKFSNMLCLAALETVPAIPLLGLGLVFGTVSVRVAFMMMIAAFISGHTFVFQGMRTVEEKFENRKGYIFIFVYTLVAIIVTMILYEVIVASLEMAIDQAIDNVKNGFMNILGGGFF